MHYRPHPIEPPRLEQQYRSRSLRDPGLRAFLHKTEWPPAPLDFAALDATARYYSPDLEVARARVRTAETGVLTARPRINPSVSLGGGWTNSPESPIVFHFDPAPVLETAGKRGYRILAAEKLAEVARLELAEAEWRVRGRVRDAWLAHLYARRSLALAEAERELRAESVEIMEKRLAVGDVSRPDADLARATLIAADVAHTAARGAVTETLTGLAASMGVPVAALAGFEFAAPPEPTPEQALSLARVQKAGLLNRADVRRSLLEYAAAEASLQLQVARQYPDIEITPGYGFDEGHHKISLSPGFTIPLYNRNRGPIAEAEGRRGEAAARFNALQGQAIGEMEKALAQYRSALAELAEARRQAVLAGAREQAVRRALAAGQEDRLTLNGARVDSAVAARASLEALRKTRAALGALEDAVQQPLEAPAVKEKP